MRESWVMRAIRVPRRRETLKIEEESTWRRRQGWEFPEQREQNVRSCVGVKGLGQIGEP